MAIIVKSVNVSPMDTNCYLLIDSDTKLCAVIDAGEYSQELKSMLQENGVEKLQYMLLTHGHFDHILGVRELQENYGGKIVIHEDDEICFTDKNISLVSLFCKDAYLPSRADITVRDNDKLMLGNSEISVFHSPGHTKGGVCYIIDDLIFCGDTLFKSSIGRSDFPGGDMMTLLISVSNIAHMKGDYKLYPGHGEATTLDDERRSNPYIIRHKKKGNAEDNLS